MKVLLVQPAFNKYMLSVGRVEPLALEILASTVDKEHQVKILDLQYEKNFIKHLKKFSPDIVGVSALSVQAKLAKKIMFKTKKFNKDIVTVIGGNHASMMPGYFNKSFVDCIVLNHGFKIFPELVDTLARKEDIVNVPGLIVFREGRMIKTPSRLVESIDSMPFPNRKLTSKYRKKYHMFHLAPEALMITAIGCPYRCSFCSCWRYTGGKYLTRSPEKIVEELLTIQEKNVFFADDNTFHDVGRAFKLAKFIRGKKIKKSFTAYARADKIVKNPDLFYEWKKIGLKRMIVGVEEIEDDILKSLNKCSSREINSKAIDILNKIGILNFAHFIINQDFTDKKFDNLKKYISKHKLFFPAFPILTPLPGSEVWEKNEKNLIVKEYDLFDLSHTLLPTKMPMKKFVASVKDLYDYNFSIKRFISFRFRNLFRDSDGVKARDIAPFFLWLWMKVGTKFAMKRMIKNHQRFILSRL